MTWPGMARAANASRAFAKATGGRPLRPTWRDLEVAEEICAIWSPGVRALLSSSRAGLFKDLVLQVVFLVGEEVVGVCRSAKAERIVGA